MQKYNVRLGFLINRRSKKKQNVDKTKLKGEYSEVDKIFFIIINNSVKKI